MSSRQSNKVSPSDMSTQESAGLGRNFLAILAGKTTGAHQKIVDNLKHCGQVQVGVHGDADYLMVFCPIASRVETDITEALSKVPAGKPIILVVMHCTFDPHHIVAESRRQVHNPDVILTVDYLFHDGKLISSNLNDISWHEIQKVLGDSTSQLTWIQTLMRSSLEKRLAIAVCVGVVIIISIALVVLLVEFL